MRTRGFKQENIIFRILSKSKVFTILGLILILLIVFPLIRKMNQKRILDREISELNQEIERIDKKNGDLKDMLDYLNSDGFIEKEGRLNLDLKKQGEKVVVVKDKNSQVEEETNTVFNIPGLDKNNEQIKTNPQKWQDYFFKLEL